MNAMHGNERGFALATAILALVVVGALVTAGFFAASQEGRVGISNAQADLAFYVAEQGVQNALGTVRKRQLRNLPEGGTLDLTGSVVVGRRTVGNYETTIRPFGGELYFLETVGTVTQGGRYAGATRRIGMVVRTMELNFPMTAALTSYGGISLRGNATVSGIDREPSQWADTLCDDTVARESGIRTRPESNIELDGNVNITGEPRIERDLALDSTEFTDFGDVDLDQLRAMANIRLAGGSYSPAPVPDGNLCVETPTNWGEVDTPTDPCFSRFPVVYIAGNLTVGGQGEGQGILIVEGNFTVSGSFRFYGIVIVLGTFNNNQGSGNAQIHGTLLTRNNANVEDNSEYRGTPVLQFSTCSATRAMEENDAVSRLFPVQERSWVDLTAAGVDG